MNKDAVLISSWRKDCAFDMRCKAYVRVCVCVCVCVCSLGGGQMKLRQQRRVLAPHNHFEALQIFFKHTHIYTHNENGRTESTNGVLHMSAVLIT